MSGSLIGSVIASMNFLQFAFLENTHAKHNKVHVLCICRIVD